MTVRCRQSLIAAALTGTLSLKGAYAQKLMFWFGPTLPKGAAEANWVQTVPGKGWNVLFRLYAPLSPGSTRHGGWGKSGW